MRKKLFLAAALAVIAVAGYVQHRNVNKQQLTDLQLADIESVAICEVSSDAAQNQGYCAPLYKDSGDACTSTGDGASVRCSGNV